MLHINGQFLRPSTEYRTLAILEELAEDNTLSQSQLGERTGLSGAMVNHYLKDLRDRNILDVRPLNARSNEYVLTAQGERLRRDLFADYCAEIVRSYTALKQLVHRKLAGLERDGRRRLVFFGASETCEIALSAVRAMNLTVLALLDNNPAKHGEVLAGHTIFPPRVIESIGCDAIVVTSFGQADDILKQVRPLAETRNIPVVRL
ncbi:DNA-binding MarR family transcriptional regulator [Desulfobaculum xiamenense]|uniref:DNA-binding MarR family transcriptional regulator n=1 Tax=Desulfobaculum xiamenense TaxID=995050 RepID=A0A846QFF9_9BACT|nr:winged helix-turn-helix transcriptional regulator [Desulfobaculum xiamenense]NJB67068.1 DNA-binding MarR family transcriptional regulator [Desulfobaculum xiamenense]